MRWRQEIKSAQKDAPVPNKNLHEQSTTDELFNKIPTQLQSTHYNPQSKLLTRSKQQSHQPLIKEAHNRHMMKT